MQKYLKPWGYYEDIYRSKECVFKKIVIFPNQKISYQKHFKRGEFWYISRGKALLKVSTMSKPLDNYSKSTLEVGETIEIIAGVAHQLINCSDKDNLEVFEMQYGECSENDILRLDDPYKRD